MVTDNNSTVNQSFIIVVHPKDPHSIQENWCIIPFIIIILLIIGVVFINRVMRKNDGKKGKLKESYTEIDITSEE